jgi:hypothetical protein
VPLHKTGHSLVATHLRRPSVVSVPVVVQVAVVVVASPVQ